MPDGGLRRDHFAASVRREVQARLADAEFAVDEFVTVAAAIAKEVPVDLSVVAIPYSAEFAVAFSGRRVAAQSAVHTNRGRRLQVPLAGEMLLERLVGEDARRADFDQVAAEFVFQHAVLVPAEIDVIVGRENVEIAPAGEVAIEPNATIALDAPVHLVVDQRTEILVVIRAFVEAEAPVGVPRHHRHVLQVAFAPLITNGAVMRVIFHQELDDRFSERHRLGVGDRDARPVRGRGHARHDDPAARVALILELFDGALPAGAD